MRQHHEARYISLEEQERERQRQWGPQYVPSKEERRIPERIEARYISPEEERSQRVEARYISPEEERLQRIEARCISPEEERERQRQWEPRYVSPEEQERRVRQAWGAPYVSHDEALRAGQAPSASDAMPPTPALQYIPTFPNRD